MTPPNPAPAGLPVIDVREAAMLFPAPLALLGAQGRSPLVGLRLDDAEPLEALLDRCRAIQVKANARNSL